MLSTPGSVTEGDGQNEHLGVPAVSAAAAALAQPPLPHPPWKKEQALLKTPHDPRWNAAALDARPRPLSSPLRALPKAPLTEREGHYMPQALRWPPGQKPLSPPRCPVDTAPARLPCVWRKALLFPAPGQLPAREIPTLKTVVYFSLSLATGGLTLSRKPLTPKRRAIS